MSKILLVQFVGAIGYSTLALSYFKKEKREILFMQIIGYIFFILHYYLLSGITGVICNFIGLLALVVIYLFDKFEYKNKLPAVLFFVLLLLIVNIMTFQNIYSIFPMIASIIVVFSFLEDKENTIRKVGVVAAICWLIYAIAYKSYIAIIFEVITLLFVLAALIKNIKK